MALAEHFPVLIVHLCIPTQAPASSPNLTLCSRAELFIETVGIHLHSQFRCWYT